MKRSLDEVGRTLAGLLDQVRSEFMEGARVTLVIRHPNLPDGGVMLTDDEADEAIAQIRLLEETGTKKDVRHTDG